MAKCRSLPEAIDVQQRYVAESYQRMEQGRWAIYVICRDRCIKGLSNWLIAPWIDPVDPTASLGNLSAASFSRLAALFTSCLDHLPKTALGRNAPLHRGLIAIGAERRERSRSVTLFEIL